MNSWTDNTTTSPSLLGTRPRPPVGETLRRIVSRLRPAQLDVEPQEHNAEKQHP